MALDYQRMSLAEIINDLSDTLADLVINAGERHLQPQFELLSSIEPREECRPSTKLVTIMEELYSFDPDQLAPRAQDLMRQAVAEIQRLHENGV